MKKFKITNKLYQPISLIVDKNTLKINSKSTKSVKCSQKTDQMSNLEQKNFIKIEEQ